MTFELAELDKPVDKPRAEKQCVDLTEWAAHD